MKNGTWWLPSADGDQEKTQMRKGPWTTEEDMHLLRYISLHGEGRWDFLAKTAGLQRTGKSCRLRWNNCLRPDLKRSKVTPEEERLIIELHGRWGNRWSRIAQNLPGRTDNDVKNYWRTRIKRKLNLQSQSGSRGSKGSYCLTTSSEIQSDLDSAEPSSSFPRQNTEEIEFQTNKIPYLVDDIWAQAIPFCKGNYDYDLQEEIHGSSQINEDVQPGLTLQEHFDGFDNLFEKSLLCNFSVRSVIANLISSELFAYGTTQDGNIASSFSSMIDSPEAFSDSECYMNDYSDVLWNMDDADERFSRSPDITSWDGRGSY